MRRTRNVTRLDDSKPFPPAISVQARQNQLISLAVDLAEKQLRQGTASSQVIAHYLKLGTMKDQLEREKLRRQNELLRAKAQAIRSAQDTKVLYENALRAMKSYSGAGQDEDYYDD